MSETFSFLQSKTAGSITIKQSVWLQAFANNSNDGIMLTDEQLKIIYVNEQFCNLFEIKESAESFIDKSITEILTSANKLLYNVSELSYKAHDASEKKEKLNQEITLSNGKIISISYQSLVIENNLIGHVWLYTDESEVSNSFRRITDQKDILEATLNNLPAGVSLLSSGGEYLWANKPEETNDELRKWMIGKNTLQYLSQANRKDIDAEKRDYYFKKVIEEKMPADWEESHIDEENKKIDISRSLIPALDAKGEIKFIVGFEKNISKQKTTETQLEQSERKFRDLFTYSKALICTHDLTGIVLSANPAMCELLECSVEDLIGKNIKDYLPETERSNFESVYLEEIKNQEKSEGLIKIFRHNGEAAYLFYNNYVMEEGNNPYVVGFAQNITQRILAEKSLKDAQLKTEEIVRSKEHFLAQMSHEIRTPMNGIIGITSLLQKTNLTGEQKFYLNIIEESAQKLLGTINLIQDNSNYYISPKPVHSQTVVTENSEPPTENIHEKSEPVSENDFINQQKEEMARTRINVLEKQAPAKENTLGNINVLLAEDNDINQVLAKNILRHWGFRNKTVSDGEKVLEALENEEFDVILMDIQMPHKNGIEVTQEIRLLENKIKRNTPIIALTAFSIRGEEKKYYEAGMDACLTKPFKEQELYDAISKVLESRKLNPETYPAPLEEKILEEKDNNEVEEVIQELTGDKLYDLSYLRGIQGSSADLVNKLIEIFIRTVPPATKEMTYASRNGDWESVSKLAHKVKSSINTMGIHSLKNDIKFVEEMALKKENLENVISKIIKIDSTVSIASQQLQEELNMHYAVLN